MLVDTGDLLPPVLDRQGELKGEVLVRAYQIMDYDAVTLGETDLFFGAAYLGSLIAKFDLPVVSANVDLGGTPSYEIVEAAGVKVAVVGLLNHRVFLPKAIRDSIRIDRMERRLEEALPRVSELSDIVVALAHVGSIPRARALADSFPGLDLIIASHVEPVPEPYYEEVNGVLIAYVRGHGRFLGRVNLLLDEENMIIGFGHEMIPMAPSLEEDPRVRGLLSEYIERLKVLVTSSAFRPTLKDLYVPPANYVTAGACLDCHQEEYAQWSETSHAHAFDTLEQRDRGFDPDCQRCHTTGFRYRSGFITPRGTPQFKHVQCEACHGPAGDHVSAYGEGAGDTGEPYGRIAEDVCVRCHTLHNSPEFDYGKYLKPVRH